MEFFDVTLCPLVIFFSFGDGWARIEGFPHYSLELTCAITGKPSNIIIPDKLKAFFRKSFLFIITTALPLSAFSNLRLLSPITFPEILWRSTLRTDFFLRAINLFSIDGGV
jgi:hypothetical protein